MSYFRAINSMTMGNLGKVIIQVVKLKHAICSLFYICNFPLSIEGTLFKFSIIPVYRVTLFTYIGILRYNYNLSPRSIKTMKEHFNKC